MMRGLVALPLLVLAVSTAAAESVVVEAGSLTTSITEDDCARLVPHVPAPDVEYRPGVDAAGRPVAPADLPGSTRIAFPDPSDRKSVVEGKSGAVRVDFGGRRNI